MALFPDNSTQVITQDVALTTVCGTNHLYDNGIAINGFVWKEIFPSSNDNPFGDYVIQGNLNIHSVDYRGDNVMCRVTGDGDNSIWRQGDVLLENSTPLHIYNSEDEQ